MHFLIECCDTCSRIICDNLQPYSVTSIAPITGPLVGNTNIVVTVSPLTTLLDTSNLKCRFNTINSHTDITGILIDNQHISCLSPPHVFPESVNLEISVDGIMWTENLFNFSYNAVFFQLILLII